MKKSYQFFFNSLVAFCWSLTIFQAREPAPYRLSWTPDLKTARRYTVYGKARLDDAAWITPTNATHHFFIVRISLPGEDIPLRQRWATIRVSHCV